MMTAPPVRRVLLTADTVGGVWTYALELARTLAERGVDVCLATMGAPLDRARRREVDAVRGAELREHTGRLEWMAGAWDDVDAAGAWLLELERELGPDVVHLNQFAFGALPWRSPALVVGHSCVWSWWHAVHGCAPPAEWERYRSRVRAGLAGADLVVAPTRTMLRALETHYGPLGAAAVIPNGRDPRRFASGRKDDLVLAVGRLWDEAKNVAALARAAQGLDWPVYVAGEVRHPDGRTAGLPGLRPLGPLAPPVVARWMRRASVYAHPARYEPFGLSVLEAALAGCALVLGDIPSLRELWDGAALFAPPDDVDALRAALRTLTRRTELRESLAARAARRAGEHTVDRFGDAYLAAYAWLGARAAIGGLACAS
ncbi:MAG TPA: glycosyltransferase family 4 protein [Gemmatimonadales bacterium]|nr:glycosyltransferase family 4 protein [Gemmatimonadales bacterium]